MSDTEHTDSVPKVAQSDDEIKNLYKDLDEDEVMNQLVSLTRQKEKLVEDLSESHLKRHIQEINDWDAERTSTVDTWIDTSSQLAFIYDIAADSAKYSQEVIQIIILVISTIDMIVSFIQLNVDETESPELSWIFKITLTVSAAINSLLSGVQTIKKYSSKIKSYSGYVEKLTQFAAVASAQITLPLSLRTNASEFILTNQDKYQSLLLEKPNLDQNDYQSGIKLYDECTKENGTQHSKLLAITELRRRVKSTSPDILKKEQVG